MDLFAFVKSRVAILDVVSEYVTLKQAGSYWKGLSPFQYEKTPSFTVSPDRGIYYCFSSSTGGDVIDFISRAENCSQRDAAILLAERYNLPLPREVDTSETHRSEHAHYRSICQFFATWCHTALTSSHTAQSYCDKRGIDEAMRERYTIGYLPKGRSALRRLLREARSHGITLQNLHEAGLIFEGKHGPYSPFEERIIFPIKDHLGRYCAFGGRVFAPHDDRAKYYNCKEHTYFHKGTALFGLDVAKKSIQNSGRVYIVEGYTDCIAMARAGYENVVATLGTACTQEHIQTLARYAQHCIAVYDGDAAGRHAVVRLAKRCWSCSCQLSVVPLPADSDPGRYCSEHNNLPEQQDVFTFFLQHAGPAFLHADTQTKLSQAASLLDVIRHVPDRMFQHLVLQQCARSLDIPVTTLTSALEQANQTSRPQHKDQETAVQTSAPSAYTTLEKKLFCATLTLGATLSSKEVAVLQNCLTHPLCTYVTLLQRHNFCIEALYQACPETDKPHLSKLLVDPDAASPPSYDAFCHMLATYKRHYWKHSVAALKRELANAKKHGDTAREKKLLNTFAKWKQTLFAKDSHDETHEGPIGTS